MIDRAGLFRACRAALGLSQTALAAELWVAHRTLVHWEAGDREVPGPAWVALAFMIEKRTGNRSLLRIIDALSPQKMGETVGEILK